jgi:cytochrome c5
VDRGEEHNPDCLPCHSTGFAATGGFVDPDEDRSLLNVQCEACHGPMLVHAQQGSGAPVRRDPGLTVTEATCRRCHDAANSPRFDFGSYLSRVMHPQNQ